MSDWGKIYELVVEKMPWVALLALAIFVLVPEAWVPEFARAFRTEWRGVALWTMVPIAIVTGVWFFDRRKENLEQQRKEKEALIRRQKLEEQEIENFNRMTLNQQEIVRRMYYELGMSYSVNAETQDIKALISEGYLEPENIPVSNRFGDLVCRVRLTQRAKRVVELLQQKSS